MQLTIENLEEGVHRINLNGDPGSLNLPDEDAAFTTPVEIAGTLSVSENNLILQIHAATVADHECSRCLKAIKVPLAGDIAVLYEKTDRAIPESEKLTEADDVEVLEYETKSIDLSHRIEEMIKLNMPLKPLCTESCKGLCSQCGINLNEATCSCTKDEVDPRWHVLRTLLKEE